MCYYPFLLAFIYNLYISLTLFFITLQTPGLAVAVVVVVVVDRAMEDAKTATTPRGIDAIINIQTQSHKLLLTNFYL